VNEDIALAIDESLRKSRPFSENYTQMNSSSFDCKWAFDRIRNIAKNMMNLLKIKAVIDL